MKTYWNLPRETISTTSSSAIVLEKTERWNPLLLLPQLIPFNYVHHEEEAINNTSQLTCPFENKACLTSWSKSKLMILNNDTDCPSSLVTLNIENLSYRNTLFEKIMHLFVFLLVISFSLKNQQSNSTNFLRNLLLQQGYVGSYLTKFLELSSTLFQSLSHFFLGMQLNILSESDH